jgi:hypothetical protein
MGRGSARCPCHRVVTSSQPSRPLGHHGMQRLALGPQSIHPATQLTDLVDAASDSHQARLSTQAQQYVALPTTHDDRRTGDLGIITTGSTS